jgi:prevent-host-death family protein
VLTSNDKGNIAEVAITLEAMKLGIDVLKPVAEHVRYDLAFDLGNRILRVQCKWATLKGSDVVYVNSTRCRTKKRGYVRGTYLAHEIDALAAYCADLDQCYLLPVELVAGTHALHLRLSAPRNNQRAAINWAENYLLPGAIAQLGERRGGTAKVAGSSPAGSTPHADGDRNEITVGAHLFRNHFGYWMERAAAGDEILITRRGRRYARLSPPDPQPATTDTSPAREPAADPAAPPPGMARTSP